MTGLWHDPVISQDTLIYLPPLQRRAPPLLNHEEEGEEEEEGETPKRSLEKEREREREGRQTVLLWPLTTERNANERLNKCQRCQFVNCHLNLKSRMFYWTQRTHKRIEVIY